MLLEIAIGDAYGAAFEYADSDFVTQNNTLLRYYRNPRHAIGYGCYTDDTQMSLAVAESLLEGGPWTEETLARHFVEAFKRDPREGYAGGFYRFLQQVETPQQFLNEIRNESDKSGAAMRACPLGVLAKIEDVISHSRIQAAVTHNTHDGIHAATAAALACHYFIYRLGEKAQLGEFLQDQIEGAWAVPWRGKVGSKGWMSVRAAVTAIIENDHMSDLLKACIAFEGDVDTVATIALGAASNCDHIEQDLPQVLFDELENGDYGRDYIAALDEQLMRLVVR